MNKTEWTKWLGQRLAEFQFGNVIQGWFKWVLFIPVYLKMYHLKWWAWILLTIAGTILTWLPGWWAYKKKLVENFRRKEFEGVIK